MQAANDNGPRRMPKPVPKLTQEQRGRFWMNVDKSGGPDSCWPWTGTIDGEYGRAKIDGRLYLAHRVAASDHLDDRLESHRVVRHSCDNPPCCNPKHLLPGTYSENTQDMIERSRANPVKGELHRLAAANDNLVRDILASPLSGRKAAAHFGVSYGLVANIRSGRSWKHIEREAA